MNSTFNYPKDHCYSVMSNSLLPYGLQHTRPLYPFTISWSLLKLMSFESVKPSNHVILCHRLLLPSIFPSIRVFSNESALLISWPKYWSFSFSISPFNEFSGLLPYRIDWFDLLAVSWDSQESSLAPQYESINSSSLSLLYGPIHICACYWKNHSFDCTDLCQ